MDTTDYKSNTNAWIVDKFMYLKARIESKNPSIDDLDLRWVTDKIEYFEAGVVEDRECFERANKLWKKWSI